MDTPQKLLIITGSAPCVIDDLTALPRRIPAADDMAIGLDFMTALKSEIPRRILAADYMAIGLDAVDKYPWPIRYCATFHPAEIPQIRARREALIGRVDFAIISHERHEFVEIFVGDWWQPSGSSSLLGVQAALRMGYKRIILCGCPLAGQNDKGGKYEGFRTGWEARKKDLVDCVRSMSGWTADFLGKPTEEWLLSGEKQ